MASTLLCFALPCSSGLFAQSAEWDRLNQQLMSLYQKGDYQRATELAKMALELAEGELGPEHPDVAISLNNLAGLYHLKGEYVEAERLYRRTLAIWEKALEPDHPDVALVLENFAKPLRATERESEANEKEARARAIRAKGVD